jgi:prepilin-type N-terminal cleavage/methylation domain-containing protein
MSRKSRGFTLVEMLVVISIIGVLMGLVLPAIQNARERGRMTQCSNNMRQLAMALTNYETQKQVFPGYTNLLGRVSGTTDNRKIVSFVVPVLANLERSDMLNLWSDDSKTASQCYAGDSNSQLKSIYIGALQCVSDGAPDNLHPWTSYIANSGCANTLDAPYPAATPATFNYSHLRNEGVFFDTVNNEPAVGTSYVSSNDGAAYTMMLSENVGASMWAYPWSGDSSVSNALVLKRGHRARTLNTFVWWDASSSSVPDPKKSFINSARDQAEQYVTADNSGSPFTITPGTNSDDKGPTNDDQSTTGTGNTWEYARPSSRHIGGAFVAFCDSRLVFLAETVDYQVYRQLMTPNGKLASCFNCTATNDNARPGPLADGTY